MQTSCRLIPSAKAAPQLRQYFYFCATKATAVRSQAAVTADFFRKRIKEGENERKRRGFTSQFKASQLPGGFRKEDFWQAF